MQVIASHALVDVGNYGKDNDAHIFNNSDMGKAFLGDEIVSLLKFSYDFKL